jgi:hypothetical protein
MPTTMGLALVRSDRGARLRDVAVLVGLVLWMLYTRLFWPARGIHATLPACPFLTLTGHPCPFCGGTRSFAYMWQGDLRHAALLYPLGPLLFVGTLLAIAALMVMLVSGRTWAWRLPDDAMSRVLLLAGPPLAASWLLKLTVLPN